MTRAEDLRETAAGLSQAAGFLAQATRALFDLFPPLDEAAPGDPAVPPAARALASALSEAGAYVGDALREVERYASEAEDPAADWFDLVTETTYSGRAEVMRAAEVMRDELRRLASEGRIELVEAPPQGEVARALARGATELRGWSIWRCVVCGVPCAGSFGCACGTPFDLACPYSSANAKR